MISRILFAGSLLIMASLVAAPAVVCAQATTTDPAVLDVAPIDVPGNKDTRHASGEFEYIEVPKSVGTCVYGTMTKPTTWTKAKSPYIVCEDTFVARGSALKIEPGVVVKFLRLAQDSTTNKAIHFRIEGKLDAQGTPDQPIYFIPFSDKPDHHQNWDGITFMGQQTSVVTWCIVEYARFGLNCQAPCVLGHNVVKDCFFGIYLDVGGEDDRRFRGAAYCNVLVNNYHGIGNNGTKGNCWAMNSIFYLNGNGIQQINEGNLYADYNLYLPNSKDVDNNCYDAIEPGAHDVKADPKFVDAAKLNYKLAASSPARGKGYGGGDIGLKADSWTAEGAKAELNYWLNLKLGKSE